MNPYKNLMKAWLETGTGQLTDGTYDLYLPPQYSQQFAEICLSYPKLNPEMILRDLLAASLVSLEQSIPYEPGTKVIAIDEHGDEIYEDCGLTPKLLSLSKEFQERLR